MFYTFTYKNWLLLEILTNENLLGNFKLAWIYFEKLGTLVTFFDDIIDFHESSQNDIPQRIVKITSLDKVKICLIIIFSSFLHWHFDEKEWKKRMPNQLSILVLSTFENYVLCKHFLKFSFHPIVLPRVFSAHHLEK